MQEKVNLIKEALRKWLPQIIILIGFLIGLYLRSIFVTISDYKEDMRELKATYDTNISTLTNKNAKTQRENDTLKVKFRLFLKADELEKKSHDFELGTLKRRFGTFKSETEMFIQNERVSFNLLENDVIRLQEQAKK